MGNYTVDLRYLVERHYPLALDKYPIWSEEYRAYLNNKIIEHFYFREIGLETPDRFNFFLSRKMNEIMPYYNKLYESELIQFDPLASEYIREDTGAERNRVFENTSQNKGKRSETVGDVFSSNRDTKADTVFGQKSTENNAGKYSKKGDKVVDTTSEKVEDFDQNKTSKQTEDFTETKTSEKNEDFKQGVTRNELLTNDLHTKQVSDGSAVGSSKKTGSNDTTFSDIPQAGVETTVVTAPDGTVTRTTKGYATTTTNVDITENINTTETTKNTTNTDNTGTAKTDTTETTVNDNVTNVADSKQNDNVTDFTEDVTNDNTTDFTQNETTKWSESGDHTEDTDYKNDETTNNTGNEKEDTERNTTTNSNNINKHAERSDTNEKNTQNVFSKGRRGVSPSELIMKYRDSFMNIDMLVINELETLFMGVY